MLQRHTESDAAPAARGGDEVCAGGRWNRGGKLGETVTKHEGYFLPASALPSIW